MGKNFKKNTPRKSFDGKGIQNKGPGSVSKPGQNQNKGNNRYFSKQLDNMKSPGANVMKTPNSNNKNQNQKFGSNKKSPMQNNKSPANKSPAHNKQLNGKGKKQSFKKSPNQKEQVKKDKDESEESESFSDGDDSEEGFDTSMLSKLIKNEADVDDSDFDDIEDIEDSEEDEDDSSEVLKAMVAAGKKRKLEEDSDDSSDSDDLDDKKLKALLEESSDEADVPPAKKSKPGTKSPDTKSPKAPAPKKGNTAIPESKPVTKQQQKKVPEITGKQQPKNKANLKQKPGVESKPCIEEIKLPASKVTLKVADKEKIIKLVKERLDSKQCRTVFIRPVPRNCSFSMLKEMAKEIVDARIPRKGNNSRGFAILEFKTPQIAEKYQDLLNGKIFCGKTLAASVNSSTNTNQKFDPTAVMYNQLYVSCLPRGTTRADLKYIFPECSSIELPVMKDNNCKGFALIDFALPETALNHFETRHQTVIRNCSINVNFSIAKKSKATPAKTTTKATKKKPAVKLSPIVPKKASVKVDKVMDDSDESETEEILAALKQSGVKISGTTLSALMAAQGDGSSDNEDSSEGDIKSPPAKRKPVASK